MTFETNSHSAYQVHHFEEEDHLFGRLKNWLPYSSICCSPASIGSQYSLDEL